MLFLVLNLFNPGGPIQSGAPLPPHPPWIHPWSGCFINSSVTGCSTEKEPKLNRFHLFHFKKLSKQ